MKILWLTENYPPQRGGMSVSCDRIVRSLRKLGLVIDVAHFSSRYSRWKTEQRISGKQFNCPVEEDIAHTINRLWNLVEKEKYTHFVAFGGLLPMLASPVFADWLNIPLITMIRGNDFDTGIFSLKRGDVLRECLEKSTVICAVSNDKVEKISKLYPAKKVVWTPNGVNLTDWEFAIEDKKFAEDFRLENVRQNQKILGLFGQLKRKKGGLFFLENLKRSGLDEKFHLLLVGDIDDEMTDWLGNQKDLISFTLLPFLDRFELLPYYAVCDFVVIPSFYDGMPNVLLESAALGIPSISSNTGGMRDILEDQKTTIFFETGDNDSCQKAIELAANIDTESHKKLKENCFSLAKQFSPEFEVTRYLEVFMETSDKRSYYAEK